MLKSLSYSYLGYELWDNFMDYTCIVEIYSHDNILNLLVYSYIIKMDFLFKIKIFL